MRSASLAASFARERNSRQRTRLKWGLMHRSIWTYAWDILDLGYDAALGELRDRAGLNSVSLASSYHAGRFLQPRSPRRKVYFPEGGTIYFHPTPARWEGLAIRPKVAGVILEGGDVLRELVRRR